MKNFLGHPIQWRWEMNKINPPLAVSLQEPAMRASSSFFGYPQSVTSYWYDHGDIYFDEEENRTVEQFISHLIEQDARYPDRISRKIYLLARKIKNQQIDTRKFKTLRYPELYAYYKKEREPMVEMMEALAERGPVPIVSALRQKLTAALSFTLGKQKKIRCTRGIPRYRKPPSASQCLFPGEEKCAQVFNRIL